MAAPRAEKGLIREYIAEDPAPEEKSSEEEKSSIDKIKKYFFIYLITGIRLMLSMPGA